MNVRKNSESLPAPASVSQIFGSCLALTVVRLILFGSISALGQEAQVPPLVPTPKMLTMEQGSMPLTGASRIVTADPSLTPLANVLSDEIAMVTGLKLAVAQGNPGQGDIGLKINPAIRAGVDIIAVQKQKVANTRDFAHSIAVGDSALVEGWDYRAVAEGTATVLQAISIKDGEYFLPQMKILDWPHADYTGVMVDVARQEIPIDALKAVIAACRLWKIRYCQLHLTDDEGFTFPSTAFPKLGTKNKSLHNGVVPRVYSLKELRDLVAYADARGVSLVPELAAPGHSEAMARVMPEVFGEAKIMNMANDEMYNVLDILVGEMCDVFRSSPYFHIGCDEMYFYELEEQQQTKDYLQKKGIKNVAALFVQHVQRMNDLVRKRGKITLAWEGVDLPSESMGFVLPEELRSQVIAMCWLPYSYSDEIRKRGFTTITVPWDLGAPLSEWNMYLCNGVRFEPTNPVLGASQTMWQMSASALVGNYLGGELNGSTCEGYIRSLGIRSERTWGPNTVVKEDEYQKRLTQTRTLLDKLLFPVKIDGTTVEYQAWPVLGRQYCKGPVEVAISLTNPINGGEIRYTIDGSEPLAQSPIYAAPFTVNKNASINAALFRAGRQVGAVSRTVFDMKDSDWSIYK